MGLLCHPIVSAPAGVCGVCGGGQGDRGLSRATVHELTLPLGSPGGRGGGEGDWGMGGWGVKVQQGI